MTSGPNGKGPMMVNVGSCEREIWVDADAFAKGEVGDDFWAGVCNGGQILTEEELSAINKFTGTIVAVEKSR